MVRVSYTGSNGSPGRGIKVANAPDLREQQWLSVFLSPIAVANSVITVSDTFGLHPKAPIVLTDLSGNAQDFEIKRVLNDTQIQVGSIGTGITGPYANPVAFNGGTLQMGEVNRNKFGSELVLRAVYQEEPATALRNLLVNKYGAPIDTSLDANGKVRIIVDTGTPADPLPYTDDVKIVYGANGKASQYQFYLATVLKYTVDVTYNTANKPIDYQTTVI